MKKQLAVFVALLALIAGTAPAVLADEDHGGYLALGDSVPFGFSPLIPPAQRGDPSVFVGYPEAYAAMHELSLTNLSCPGETSGSMIATPTPPTRTTVAGGTAAASGCIPHTPARNSPSRWRTCKPTQPSGSSASRLDTTTFCSSRRHATTTRRASSMACRAS